MYFVNKLSGNGDDFLEENRRLEETIKSRGGMVMQAVDIPQSVYNQFLKSVLAFEEADNTENVLLRKLFPKDFTLPSIHTMNAKQLSLKLEEIYKVLAENNVIVELQEDLSDALAYRFLQKKIHTVKISNKPKGRRLHLSGCDWDCPHCFQRDCCTTNK